MFHISSTVCTHSLFVGDLLPSHHNYHVSPLRLIHTDQFLHTEVDEIDFYRRQRECMETD